MTDTTSHTIDIEAIKAENARRNAALTAEFPYDPLTGDPEDPSRETVEIKWEPQPVSLPRTMLGDPEYKRLKSAIEYKRLRMRHDFEYWAIQCVKIRHKQTGQRIAFRLNAPQRRVVRGFESERLAGRPLRFIMLKARQWGGSTLVQMYFAWIQSTQRRNWNSLICAHVKDTAAGIRGMYSDMLAEYPDAFWLGDEPPKFTPWQKSANTREISGRGCKVTIASSFGQDAVRGLDFSMAHLSEVAFWKDTERMTPADFIRSVCGGIPSVELSMVVLESTANGVANYFHTMWKAAEEGSNVYRQVFVPWYEIEMYRTPCPDPEPLVRSWTAYERELWDKGLTLEMIQWYHDKRREFVTDKAMMAEYPSNPVEAFANTGNAVFASEQIERLRKDCRRPLDLNRISLPLECRPLLETPSPDGELKIWTVPDDNALRYSNRYVAVVDVGGRTRHSDYSVIVVIDRCPADGSRIPTVAAQWRGHCDHDLLGIYAASMGQIYGKALLVIESNSLESSREGASQYILEDLNHSYRNLYVRRARDNSGDASMASRVGFHTNRSTKTAVVTNLIGCVRNHSYRERDAMACDELATYELTSSGAYAAHKGFHDDLLMTRAIGLYVISTLPTPNDRVEMLRGLGFRRKRG